MEFEFIYRFEIIYQSKNLKDVSDFMSKLDPGTVRLVYTKQSHSNIQKKKSLSHISKN